MPKIVKMANQIAGFFESQPGDRAAAVAAHINDNWSPAMRADLMAVADDPALHALVRAALAQLRPVPG